MRFWALPKMPHRKRSEKLLKNWQLSFIQTEEAMQISSKKSMQRTRCSQTPRRERSTISTDSKDSRVRGECPGDSRIFLAAFLGTGTEAREGRRGSNLSQQLLRSLLLSNRPMRDVFSRSE